MIHELYKQEGMKVDNPILLKEKLYTIDEAYSMMMGLVDEYYGKSLITDS